MLAPCCEFDEPQIDQPSAPVGTTQADRDSVEDYLSLCDPHSEVKLWLKY